ncbi:uncharacterized protein LOC133286026 [Gastrolobium bilobum]|uniref:uncharacterized protein LOC133286026 n=1 Tax=Gastrolobium bilobum TaxID=150636 RepID=UPI002AB15ABF|nr:uncharacterized protein LOC133286026 [Gastrolobium bilobum]
MYSRYDFIKDLNPSKEEWRIKGGRIHATVKGTLNVRKKICEGDVYFIRNFGGVLNSDNFRPTRHDYRLSFNLRTDVKSTEDATIPANGFSFVDFDVIERESADSPYLVDVIGLLSGIGDVREHVVSARKTKMVVLELDDLRMSSDPIESSMRLTQLSSQSSYSFENDFLKDTERKSISDIKNCSEITTCITYGTIKSIESKYNWWFSVQVRVVDNTDYASFILFDKDCVALLGMGAAEIREQHFKVLIWGLYPEELNILNEKSMLFKDVESQTCESTGDANVSLSLLSPSSNFNNSVEDKYICTIEFQKRGLPHAHIILFLHSSGKPNSGSDIDKLISAEIPNKDTNPSLFMVVNSYMMHGPCGPENHKSPCMKERKCSKKFPKIFSSRTLIDDDGFAHYRRLNNGRVVNKNGAELDNHYVVPYNAKLLLKYQAYINVEYTCQRSAIKYLFKYIHKGNDRVIAAIHHSNSTHHGTRTNDEIKMIYDCSYVSACEAAWRIFGFDIHYRYPPVKRLPFHLPNQKSVVFNDSASISDVKTMAESRRTIFESWMEANKNFPEGRDLTYAEYLTHFVYVEDAQEWRPRKRVIRRINHFSSNNGEDSYLRVLLTYQKGCTSYDDLRIINGVLFPSFKDACYSLGLLDDDNEYIDAIKEANFCASAYYLRNLLLYYAVLDEESIKNTTLAEIDKVLQSNGMCLSDYPTMPRVISESLFDMPNRLVLDELSYDRCSLMEEHKRLNSSLNDEQRVVYEKIISAVLAAFVRSKGKIVLNVASSRIASLLLPGGRTTHS